MKLARPLPAALPLVAATQGVTGFSSGGTSSTAEAEAADLRIALAVTDARETREPWPAAARLDAPATRATATLDAP